MTVDRNALATDLERLGLKAISGSVRRDTISAYRALSSVKRLHARELGRAEARRHARPDSEEYADRLMHAEHAAEAREVLERYGGAK